MASPRPTGSVPDRCPVCDHETDWGDNGCCTCRRNNSGKIGWCQCRELRPSPPEMVSALRSPALVHLAESFRVSKRA